MRVQEQWISTKGKILLMIFFGIPIIGFTFFLNINYEVAKISDLYVGYSYNGQIIKTEIIPRGTNHIFACGTLLSRGPNYLNLGLFDETEEIFFGYDKTSNSFSHGDFCSEFDLRVPMQPGDYKVVIRDKNTKVGEISFRVE